MPTEDLTYKVTFDTSEVAQKLNEVKNALDVAFGAQAFNAAGPDPFPFQGLFNAATSMSSNAMSSAQQGVQMAQSTFSSVQNMFNTVAETARLGYGKFSRDLEMTGLMSGGMRGAPHPLTYGQQIASIERDDFWGNVGGMMGFGYRPTMTMSAAEYSRRNRGELMDKFMEPSWSEAIGLGVGAVATIGSGPVGWGAFALTAAPFAAKAALYPFTSELRHQRALESYVRGTSWRFLSGQFNREDTEGLGRYLRDLPDQGPVAARGYGRTEVDEVLNTFTEAGGFDYVRNAREYRQKVDQVFQGHRELMHTLHITSKEASALMGQLSRELGVENFAGFSANVGVLADRAGLTRNEAATFIMQSAEMVRGTGYGMGNFALGAGRLLEDVRGMAQAGILTKEDIRQFGGEQNIALNMARSAMNFAGSPTGFVSQAALMSAQLGGAFGGPGGPQTALGQMASMGMQGQLATAANYFNDPMDFVRFFGQQQQLVDQMGPEVAMQQKTMLAIEQAQRVFGRKSFSSADLYGAFRAMGIDHQQAREMVVTRDAAASDKIPTIGEDYYNRALAVLEQREEEGESPAARALRQAGSAIEGTIWKPITGTAEGIYVGIEQGSAAIGRGLERAWETATGGIFETISTKPAGLATAWRLGGDYAKKHKDLMTLNDKEAAALESRIMADIGDTSLNVIRYRRRQNIQDLSLADARAEVQGYIENKNRDVITDALGYGYDVVPGGKLIGLASKFLGYIGFESGTSAGLGETAEALGFEREGFQSDIARLAYSAAVQYDKLKDPKQSREDFIKSTILKDLKKDSQRLGEKGLSRLKEVVEGMDMQMVSAFVQQGAVETRHDRENYQKELRDVAITRLENSGIKRADISEAMIEKEKAKVTDNTIIARLLGVDEEKIAGRSEAGDIFRQRLAATKLAGYELFKTQTDQGYVFDESTAKITNAMNQQLMADALTKMASGRMTDAEAIPVKMVELA